MIRFAVIGTSDITREFLRLSKTVEDFELTAVYSRSLRTAERFALEVGARLYFDSLDELAACNEVDAVYIASPNICHKEQAIRMLSAKKHVLVEKPAAASKEDFVEMERVAKENGVILVEAMRAAFVPGTKAIMEALPRLGTVRRATISFCQYSVNYDNYKRGEETNTFNPALANGSLMDLGVYCARACVFLFGEPTAIKAAVNKLPNGYDAQGTVICEYPEMLAELRFSKIAKGSMRSEIQGEDAALIINDMFYPTDVRIEYRAGGEEVIYSENAVSWGGLNYETAAFIKMIETGEFPAEKNELTKQTLALMDEVRSQLSINFVNPMHLQGPNLR